MVAAASTQVNGKVGRNPFGITLAVNAFSGTVFTAPTPRMSSQEQRRRTPCRASTRDSELQRKSRRSSSPGSATPRERFGELVALLQRRAARIAYHITCGTCTTPTRPCRTHS